MKSKSGKWLGNHSPKTGIKESGLWLSQHLYNEPIKESDKKSIVSAVQETREWISDH